MATIKDIARETQLSIATVSLVLNNKECRVSDKTRELVLSTAKRMNYRPNKVAVGLVTKRTNTIGLVVPDISNLFFSELAKAVEEQAQQQGYTVFFCNTNDSADKDVEYIRVLQDRGVDGVILAMSSRQEAAQRQLLLQVINEGGKPVVTIDRAPEELSVASVLLDDHLGGYLAAGHLIEQGHRRIGCITGPLAVKNAGKRYDGYRQALQEAGIPFDQRLVYEGDYHTDSGYAGAKALWAQGMTAVFACNDMMAYGVYRYFKQQNILIPAQCSVVGFDDILFSESLDVPLTTVRQPVYAMGKEACRLLIAHLNKRREAAPAVLFKPEIVIRSSTTHCNFTGEDKGVRL